MQHITTASMLKFITEAPGKLRQAIIHFASWLTYPLIADAIKEEYITPERKDSVTAYMASKIHIYIDQMCRLQQATWAAVQIHRHFYLFQNTQIRDELILQLKDRVKVLTQEREDMRMVTRPRLLRQFIDNCVTIKQFTHAHYLAARYRRHWEDEVGFQDLLQRIADRRQSLRVRILNSPTTQIVDCA